MNAADEFNLARQRMVNEQMVWRGIDDEHLLEVLRRLPRHVFVPMIERADAYADHPLAIGCNQTISQPYIVAYMTQLLALKGDETVLEVGTGSGYQTAVLGELCRRVISMERYSDLAELAAQRLAQLGYNHIEVVHADGTLGWPVAAPYQAILVTAAAPETPPALLEQLADGGRMVIPVGGRSVQELKLWTRNGDDYQCQNMLPVVFVPLRGAQGWPEEDRSCNRGAWRP